MIAHPTSRCASAAPVRHRDSAGVTSMPVAALIAPARIPPVPAMPSTSSRT